MALVLLVRHGQASFGTDHYDRLSTLGRQQARWLGEHLLASGTAPVRVVSGALDRQRHTADEILAAMGSTQQVEIDPRLDEYHGDALYACHTGGADPRIHQQRDRQDYWRTFRVAMQAWADDRLPGVPESWTDFGQRVLAAIRHAVRDAGRDDRVLIVSSGGAIGRVVCEIMGAPAATAIELNLQFRNTGVCELIAGTQTLRLLSYNSVPHLEAPERRSSVTFA
jgi:broad specificity phosphatase PhoE